MPNHFVKSAIIFTSIFIEDCPSCFYAYVVCSLKQESLLFSGKSCLALEAASACCQETLQAVHCVLSVVPVLDQEVYPFLLPYFSKVSLFLDIFFIFQRAFEFC